MPGPYFVPDKCQDPISVRTNARTTFWARQMPGGQMPGSYFFAGQMPGPYFGPDKCLEGQMPGPDICPLRHLSVQAFVLRAISQGWTNARTRHLSFEALVC